MTYLAKRLRWIATAVVLISPVPMFGQAVTRADMIGTWRMIDVVAVDWDSVKGVSVRPYEYSMTLRGDGAFVRQLTRYIDEAGEQKIGDSAAGRWSLTGDTLVMPLSPEAVESGIRSARFWRMPLPPTEDRYMLSRNGKMLTMLSLRRTVNGQDTTWNPGSRSRFYEYERVDTTKPLPALVAPPSTLQRADLVGTWATETDTLVLRADSTWTADTLFVEEDMQTAKGKIASERIIAGCEIAKAAPTVNASGSGKWYLGPANTVVLVDTFKRKVCSTATSWRGGRIKVRDRQFYPTGLNSPGPAYKRIK